MTPRGRLLTLAAAAVGIGGGSALSPPPAAVPVVEQPRSSGLRAAAASAPPLGPLQVITDIDDTVKSSGGVRFGNIPIGGVDTQYARGEFYPGVFKFMVGLATHGTPPAAEPVDAAVLTARAREFQWALALTDDDPICRQFRAAGQQAGHSQWKIGTVLYGSVNEWVFQRLKGRRKFENFKILLSQAPRDEGRCFVFVGDTGELDREAGELMLIHYPHLMRGLFLHVVGDAARSRAVPDDIFINGRPVVFFRTYVWAAWKAAEHQLMALDDVMVVAKESCAALSGVDPASTKWTDVRSDIQAVAREAEALLEKPAEASGESSSAWAESREGLKELADLARALADGKP